MISDQSQEQRKSLIYILPVSGGTPRRVTQLGPSYWHGWSPDGKTLAYCAERNGEYDVYTIPAEGGEEKRLTTSPGLDDGPDYSPDGKTIYFNSVRTGTMQIWRMEADGGSPATGHFRRAQQLVSTSLPRREMDRFSVLRKGSNGPPCEQGRHAADDAGRRGRHSGSGETVRRAGYRECTVVVA